MILTVNYFAGSLNSYKKERLCSAEIGPTRSIQVEWQNSWGDENTPTINLSVPEWGVQAIKVYNSPTCGGIVFIPDDTQNLMRIVRSNSKNLSERLIVKIDGITGLVKRPSFRNQSSYLVKLPHFMLLHYRLDQAVVEGPRVEGGLIFTSRINFAFT